MTASKRRKRIRNLNFQVFIFTHLLLQICSVLAYLHQNKVVHRDVQPRNVYIDGDGNARLALGSVSKSVAEFVMANDASAKDNDSGVCVCACNSRGKYIYGRVYDVGFTMYYLLRLESIKK